MPEPNKHLVAQTLVFPLFTKRLNGCLYVTKSEKLNEKLFYTFEIGLFTMPVQELTAEAIKAKYGLELPKDFLFDSE